MISSCYLSYSNVSVRYCFHGTDTPPPFGQNVALSDCWRPLLEDFSVATEKGTFNIGLLYGGETSHLCPSSCQGSRWTRSGGRIIKGKIRVNTFIQQLSTWPI